MPRRPPSDRPSSGRPPSRHPSRGPSSAPGKAPGRKPAGPQARGKQAKADSDERRSHKPGGGKPPGRFRPLPAERRPERKGAQPIRAGNSRKAVEGAVSLLDAISAAKEPADRVRHAWMREHHRRFAPEERSVLIHLSEEVLRQRGRLDWWIARDKAALPPDNRLRLAAYRVLATGAKAEGLQFLFDAGPAEAVEFLRRLEGHTLEHPDMPPAARFNVPQWVLPHLKARFGADLDLELAAMLRPAPLDVRINPLKTSRDAAAAALAAEGLRSQPTPFSPCGLRLSPQAYVNNGQAYAEGLIEPQDEGSQLAAQLVDAAGARMVVDFCAGAGGKTLVLAAAMRNAGRLIALDVSAGRLAQAKLRLRRAGVHNAETRAMDAKWLKRHAGQADRVLVDAPCTGTGTWRRKPDAKWRLQPQDLQELVQRQVEILDRAAKLVKPSGWLIYATCSVLRPENDDQVTAFLQRHPEFETVPVGEVWPQAIGGACPVAGPYLTLSPARHGTDGFFAAILRHRG